MLFHVEYFYRYNAIEYKKFPVDVWEDVCDWFDNRNKTGWVNKSKAYILEWVLHRVLKYANFNHPCPFVGDVYMSCNNISQGDYFNIPQFVPSGRYRVDMYITDKTRKIIYISGKAYFEISDHRIERF